MISCTASPQLLVAETDLILNRISPTSLLKPLVLDQVRVRRVLPFKLKVSICFTMKTPFCGVS